MSVFWDKGGIPSILRQDVAGNWPANLRRRLGKNVNSFPQMPLGCPRHCHEPTTNHQPPTISYLLFTCLFAYLNRIRLATPLSLKRALRRLPAIASIRDDQDLLSIYVGVKFNT